MADRDPVLIQQSRKKYKAMQVAGFLLGVLGIVAASSVSSDLGIVIIVVAAAVYALGSFLAWWHHG